MTPKDGAAMNQTSILDPAWLMTAAAHLFDVVGLGGLALAWRAGGRVAKVEQALALQDKVNLEVKARLDQHSADQTMVREKLAALPTHDQVAGMIREVREDIRELKRTG